MHQSLFKQISGILDVFVHEWQLFLYLSLFSYIKVYLKKRKYDFYE